MSHPVPRNIRIMDSEAITRNMQSIRTIVPDTAKVMAVVKADGYGHGALLAARAALAGGADMLAVATADEGSLLRAAGISAPILVLGAVAGADAEEGVENDLIQTVCNPEMIRICEKASAKLGKQTEVHIKIDTGMGRIGVRTEDAICELLSALNKAEHLRLTGAFTHFSDADDGEEGEAYTEAQFKRFLDMTALLPDGLIRHCANSAAIQRHPEMSLEMVRAGISLYGYPPVPSELQLKPCMRWMCRVSYIHEVPAGAYISYGRTYRTDHPARIAAITCGYGDGYHRCASGKAEVLIRGRRWKVIGRICMDQMMVDITGDQEIQEGDPVVLMGRSGQEEITAEDIAGWCQTISYEILLSSGSRVTRIRADEPV